MLYHLLPGFADVHIVFNLFRFITFRAAGALVTSLVIAFLLGPITIRMLKQFRVGQVIRSEGPSTHLEKAGTPTMGGVLIVSSTAITTLLWAELTNWYTILSLLTLLAMGAIGLMDDYLKVVRGRTRGLVARYKMVGQWIFGLGFGLFLLLHPISPVDPNRTMLPFFSDLSLLFTPWFYVIFVAFVISGSSNAVNITDGLDGLAAGLAAISAATFGIFAYLLGRFDSANYLGLFYLPGAGELTVLALALTGGCLGFLWFNSHPAEVFMGDTGSLALGGVIGAMAILLKIEFLLVIVGSVFVVEVISVMLQVGYFRHTVRKYGIGKRIFKMAPLHHHFEELGWPESKVVVRFWIMGILSAIVAFSALKIR
tara:strand:+ start:1406 stop:2512 length:1107 start_codon:yes stop_codon:yes gene_type:complete